MLEFKEFPKIARLNRGVIVTEKIDGTNGQVHIRKLDGTSEHGIDSLVATSEDFFCVRAGSRNRWLRHDSSDDNYGFGRWVAAHADELAKLGAGTHYGEWWGQGIQRGYGEISKHFSLFNVARWSESRPACCDVVPIVLSGTGFDSVSVALDMLREFGSMAAPKFMKPEGIMAFHTASRTYHKVTLEKDKEHKGNRS